MIDIIIPVLARPQNAARVAASIANSTSVEHTVVFVCTPGDTAEISACEQVDTAAVLMTNFSAGPGDFAKKVNLAYRTTFDMPAPFVFCAADDVVFTDGWDLAILAEAKRTGSGMVGCDDGANPLVRRGRHSTHSLFSREYVDTIGATFFDGPGVLYHEGYAHQWVDTEAVKAAMDRGQWAFARRALVQHHHPIYDRKVTMDSTYERGLGQARHDAQLYRERLQRWSRRDRVTVL